MSTVWPIAILWFQWIDERWAHGIHSKSNKTEFFFNLISLIFNVTIQTKNNHNPRVYYHSHSCWNVSKVNERSLITIAVNNKSMDQLKGNLINYWLIDDKPPKKTKTSEDFKLDILIRTECILFMIRGRK